MLRKQTATLLLIFCVFCFYSSYSQCKVAPPPDPCTGTEPVVTDNEILPVSTKKWFYAAPASFNQLTLRGGTLVVCGNLTIDKLVMDSGTIVVRPGAQLMIRGGLSGALIFEGNTAIYNYGTTQITSNLTLSGANGSAAKPNVIVNAYGAYFSLASQYFVINSPYSYFVNNGKSEFHGIITDNGSVAGSVCLGTASETSMTVLINKIKRSYVASTSGACVQVRQYSQFYDTLTASPSLYVCLSSGHTSDAGCIPFGCKPNAWGAAQLFNSCTTCGSIALLSFRYLDFAVNAEQSGYRLSWITSASEGHYRFVTERSQDGTHFDIINEQDVLAVDAHTPYRSRDAQPPAGEIYYRVRTIQVATGKSYTSNIIKVQHAASGAPVTITPNPFQQSIRITWQAGKRPVSIVIMSAAGNVVYAVKPSTGDNASLLLQLPGSLAAGSYLVKVLYKGEATVYRVAKY